MQLLFTFLELLCSEFPPPQWSAFSTAFLQNRAGYHIEEQLETESKQLGPIVCYGPVKLIKEGEKNLLQSLKRIMTPYCKIIEKTAVFFLQNRK